MWYALLLVTGSVLAVLVIAWRVHRHQRDIDGELEFEYRAPLPFQWQGPL